MKYTIWSIVFLVILTSNLSAQWEKVAGPYGCDAWGFYVDGTLVYASTSQVIYQSTDNGHIWQPVQIQLPSDAFYVRLAFKHESLWLIELRTMESGNNSILLCSTDGGKTLSPIMDSALNLSVATLGTTIYVSRTPRGTTDARTLIRSTDAGNTWNSVSPDGVVAVTNLRSFGDALYAIFSRSLYQSNWTLARSYDGVHWDSIAGHADSANANASHSVVDQVPSVTGKDTVVWIAIDSNYEYASTSTMILTKILLRNDSLVIAPFPSHNSQPSQDTLIYSFLLNGSDVYASTQDQIYQLDAVTQEWQPITDRFPRYAVDKITNYTVLPGSSPRTLLMSFYTWSRWDAGYTRGIFRSDFRSTECIPSDTGISATSTAQMLVDGNTLYSLTAATGHPLYESRDHGLSWNAVELTFDEHGYDIRAIASSPKGLLYGNRDKILHVNGGLTNGYGLARQIISFLHMSDTIFCRTGNEFFRSDDSGATWRMLTMPPLRLTSGTSNTVFGTRIFVAGDSIIASDDGCQTWWKVKGIPYSDFVSNCMASDNDYVYAGARMRDNIGAFAGVLRSSDGGVTWTLISPRLTTTMNAILPVRDKVFYVSQDGVFRSNKDGSGWTVLTRVQPIPNAAALTTDSAYLYVGTSGYGIFRAPLNEVLNYADAVEPPVPTPQEASLSIVPNPANSLISVNAQANIEEISISNMLGIHVTAEQSPTTISGNSARVDVHDLPAGTYFCRVRTTTGTEVGKFVRQ